MKTYLLWGTGAACVRLLLLFHLQWQLCDLFSHVSVGVNPTEACGNPKPKRGGICGCGEVHKS